MSNTSWNDYFFDILRNFDGVLPSSAYTSLCYVRILCCIKMDWKFSSCRTAREWFDCGRVKLYTSRRSQFSVPFLLFIYRTISFDWANSRFGPIVLFFKQLAVSRRFQAVSRPAWRSGGSAEIIVAGDLNQFRYLRRVYNLWQIKTIELDEIVWFFFFLSLALWLSTQTNISYRQNFYTRISSSSTNNVLLIKRTGLDPWLSWR